MDAKILNLDSLFGGEVSYRIPQFQRPYAWKRDSQWQPLWEDVSKIADACLNAAPNHRVRPHFMGAIVLQPQSINTGEVRKVLVVDGQQRLTTLQLLIKAIEKAYLNRDDSERSARLRKFTKNPETHLAGDPDNDTKIRQSNQNDQTAFQREIRDTSNESTPQSAIKEAAEFFHTLVTEWLKSRPQGYLSSADALERTVTDLIQIAAIDLDMDEQPHIIFETLNERGEQLTQSDRIKNTVMYRANVIDNAEAARDLWGMFDSGWWRENTREGRINRSHNDRFLNYWMVMKKQSEVISERVAFEFRAFLDSDAKKDVPIHDIAAEIRTAGIFYRDIETDQIPEMKTFLRRVKALEIGTVTPILMWLATSETPWEKRKRCHSALESYLVRRMLCGLGSTGLNRFFEEILKALENGGPAMADSIMVEHLSTPTIDNRLWPNDRLLRENVLNHPLKGAQGRQRMVMEAIEESLRSEFTEYAGIGSNLTLEHVMPQGWETHWPLPDGKKDDPESKQARNNAVKEIGNLTLVTQRLNTRLSNGPWKEKRGELQKHSTLFLNKTLLENPPEVWDEDSIRERSAKLTEEIIKIWPHAGSI